MDPHRMVATSISVFSSNRDLGTVMGMGLRTTQRCQGDLNSTKKQRLKAPYWRAPEDGARVAAPER